MGGEEASELHLIYEKLILLAERRGCTVTHCPTGSLGTQGKIHNKEISIEESSSIFDKVCILAHEIGHDIDNYNRRSDFSLDYYGWKCEEKGESWFHAQAYCYELELAAWKEARSILIEFGVYQELAFGFVMLREKCLNSYYKHRVDYNTKESIAGHVKRKDKLKNFLGALKSQNA
jgi:hypothetical protein